MTDMKQDFLKRLQAKKAAVRYGHPSRSLQFVVVSGEGCSTTAMVLAEIFRESGKRAAVFTPKGSSIENVPYTPSYRASADAVHKAISAAKKQRCDVVLMAVDRELEHTGAIETLDIDLGLICDTDSASEVVLAQPLRYVVVPVGSEVDLSKVAPHHSITFGEDHMADARIKSVKLFRGGTELEVVIDHQTTVELATYLLGRTNAKRVTAAVAAAYVMGVPVEALPEGVARLEFVMGNFQMIKYEAPYRLAVDDASSVGAVEELIKSARELTRRRLLVVCDQSVDPDALAAIKQQVDRLIVVKGHSGVSTDQADSLTEAVSIAMRAAKLDDLVLMVGEELAEQVDEEQTRAARLVRGGES